MSTITTRAGKGSPLTNNEVDANFTNLNTDKAELSGAAFTGNITFTDNSKAIFGAGSDLQIYHDGSNSWIQDAGTGVLALKTDGVGISMLTSTGDTLFQANRDSDVRLYYDNSLKLATTSTGIDVTGTATMDGLTSSGIIEASDGTNGEMQFGLGTALTTGAGTYDSSVRWNGSAGNLLFSQGAVEKMRITATGIDVTGRAVVDGLTSSASIVGTSNSNSLGGTTFTSAISTVGLSSTAAITSTSNSNSLGGTSFTSNIDVTGTASATNVSLPDDGVLSLGTSDELTLKHHNSGYSHLINTTGTLYVDSDSVTFRDDDGSPSNMVISQTGIDVTGTATMDRLGLGVAAHASAALNITTTDQHIRFNNGSELGIIELDSDGELNIWAHGDGETINLKTGSGAGTDVLSVVGGNVGIGTSTVNISGFSKALTIDSSESGIELSSSGTIQALFAANTQGATVHGVGSSGIRMFTSASGSTTERMRIDSSGNVILAAGTGTLQTATAGTSNFRAGVNAGNSIVSGGNYNVVVGDEAGTAITTGDYNVAVGFAAGDATTTGSENISVGGYALSANTTGANNVGVGSGSLQSNTTASNNTAVGYASLAANTTGTVNVAVGTSALRALTTASYNTGIGYAALSTNTTGAQNTAVGYSALTVATGADNTAIGSQGLSSVTSGTYNTAVGRSAGQSVTTGVQNTLIGGLAGDAITTGVNNVALGVGAAGSTTTGGSNIAIGTSALASNTTGGTNVAVGQDNLYYNTTASNNTAIGHNAMVANTTGRDNTAVGFSAATSNTTGLENTAIGMYALRFNTTGEQNTAVGLQALHRNTTASNNTAVGRYALEANTTGSENTALGKDAGAAITSGQSNVALGFRSLYTSTTASKNVAIGDSALRAFSGGGNTFNAAIGESAGTSLTVGARNVFLGASAGRNVTTSNYGTYVGQEAGYSNVTGSNHFFGANAGRNTTGTGNTFIGGNEAGYGSGYYVTSGSKNTIIGGYNGNQGGLDIRTSSNNIVLSDGDGNVRAWNNSTGRWQFGFGSGDSVHAYSSNGANTSNSLFVGFHSSSGATTGTLAFNVTTNGNVTNINNSYGAISDVKLKENIIDASSQWDDIKALTVRKYSMKADNLDAPNMLGVVAQEVEAAGMSGLVIESHDKTPDGTLLDTTTKSVNYSILYMKAVKALQEAMERIESLEARITTLEG